MTFSIIIINYNTASLILDCLKSIYSCCDISDLEIIIVDNCSEISDRDILEKGLIVIDNKIKLIKSDTNLGFAGGNNLGAKSAGGQYLFFLNSDTILNENIFPKIKKIFIEDEKVAIISPKLMNMDGSVQAKSYGPFPSLKYLLYKNIFSKTDNNFPKIIDWVSGAALFIKKDVFNLIGGWDEHFFLYLEDVDLCWMAHDVGYKVLIDNNSQIIHLQGQSLNKNTKKQEYYYASQKYLFRKHYGLVATALLLLIRLPHKLLFILKNK